MVAISVGTLTVSIWVIGFSKLANKETSFACFIIVQFIAPIRMTVHQKLKGQSICALRNGQEVLRFLRGFRDTDTKKTKHNHAVIGLTLLLYTLGVGRSFGILPVNAVEKGLANGTAIFSRRPLFNAFQTKGVSTIIQTGAGDWI